MLSKLKKMQETMNNGLFNIAQAICQIGKASVKKQLSVPIPVPRATVNR